MLKRTVTGFSLIELMVVVALLAILLVMGVPAYRDYVTNSRVRAVASDLREGLQLARTEAIRRNNNATFCLAAASGTGWKIVTGTACTGTEVRSKPATSSEASDVTLSPTDLTVTYSGTGRTTGAAGTTLTTLSITRKDSASCSGDCLSMRVEISPGGMIRTCNTGISAGDPQACAGTSSSSSSASSASGG